MSAHSAIVGGSTAHRLLFCPANYQTQLKLPPSAEPESPYAAEGTAMHKVMAELLSDELLGAEDLIGTDLGDRVMTEYHAETMVVPAHNAMVDLFTSLGGNWQIIETEAQFSIPGIPGAFGTCDVVAASETTIAIIDWKFGAGVPVSAIYTDEHGEYANPQLMYYALGAMKTKRLAPWFRGRRIVLAIIQPRAAGDPCSFTLTTRRELGQFHQALIEAVREAIEPNPRRKRGEWCRFAACRAICPLHTGPLLDLSALGIVRPSHPVSQTVTPYGEFLGRAKRLLDAIAPIRAAIDEQLHSYLEAGGLVPGYKLKDKAPPDRKWLDDVELVAAQLRGLGFTEAEIFAPRKLQTFAIADAAAKRRKVDIPAELRPRPDVRPGTTVTSSDDPAPPPERAVEAEKFAAALTALR